MLVLTRWKHERIILERGDEKIELCVVRATGPVRLGIDAPRDWNIRREELTPRDNEGPTDVVPQ